MITYNGYWFLWNIIGASQGSSHMKYPDWSNGIDMPYNSEFIAPQDGLVIINMPSGCEYPFANNYSDILVDDIVIAVFGTGRHMENPQTVSFPVKKGTKITNNLFSVRHELFPMKFYPYHQ